jgi:hypothetical protein
MTLFKALLALLLTFVPYHKDPEAKTDRAERLATVAWAIDNAPSYRDYEKGRASDMKLVLATYGDIETRYRSDAHAEILLVGGMEGGKEVEHVGVLPVAFGHWIERKDFEAMRGTDPASTLRNARFVAKPIRHGFCKCGAETRHERLLAAFSVAARGHCKWSGADKRVEKLYAYEKRMQRLSKSQAEG